MLYHNMRSWKVRKKSEPIWLHKEKRLHSKNMRFLHNHFWGRSVFLMSICKFLSWLMRQDKRLEIFLVTFQRRVVLESNTITNGFSLQTSSYSNILNELHSNLFYLLPHVLKSNMPKIGRYFILSLSSFLYRVRQYFSLQNFSLVLENLHEQHYVE